MVPISVWGPDLQVWWKHLGTSRHATWMQRNQRKAGGVPEMVTQRCWRISYEMLWRSCCNGGNQQKSHRKGRICHCHVEGPEGSGFNHILFLICPDFR